MAIQFYKKGKDFYEVGTDRYISETEFDEGAGFEEVKKPGDISGALDFPSQTNKISEFSSMRNVMDLITREAYNRKPSVKDTLAGFLSQIGSGGMISPGVAGAVLTTQRQARTQNIGDIYRNTLRTIQAMEETRRTQIESGQQTLKNLMDMGMGHLVTGQEYEYIMQGGGIPLTLLQKAGSLQEKDLVQGMIEKYPDAGITLEDSLETARKKLSQSKIYQQATRLAGGGGGGGKITLSAEKKRILIAAGLTAAEINTIEKDISQYGIDAVLEDYTDPVTGEVSGFTDKQKEAIRGAYGGEAPTSADDIVSSIEAGGYQKTVSVPRTDPETGEEVLDDKGKQIMDKAITLDIDKIPLEIQPEVITELKNRGYFDEEDEETTEALSRWEKLKWRFSNKNPINQ